MIITSIECARGKRRCVDVYIDGMPRFEVARATATRRALRPGTAIEQTEIDEIVAADLRRRAIEAAAALLARRPRSERELRGRLSQRRFESAIIDETVARLRAARLIDDAEFARTFTESRDRTSPRARRMIEQELRANGVELSIARDAAAEVSDEDAAYRAAMRRAHALRTADYATFRTKLAGALQRRGFGWDVVRQTVERCWREFGSGGAASSGGEDDLALPIE